MRLAICLYVREDERQLLEWIVHHALIGFDTIIVLDNMSEDRTKMVAEVCGRHFDVRAETWPDTSPRAQLNGYEHVLRQYGPAFDWIAFIDSDEFILPLRHGSIAALLAPIDHAAVGLNWAIFGTGGHVNAPTGLTMAEFLTRAPDDFPPNMHIKSIVRPSRVLAAAHPHLFHLDDERVDEKTGYQSDYVDCEGQPMIWGQTPGFTTTASLDVCRVNHYFTRSIAHWRKKMARRWRDVERNEDAFHYHDRNEVPDHSALPFAAAVGRAIERTPDLHRLAEELSPIALPV